MKTILLSVCAVLLQVPLSQTPPTLPTTAEIQQIEEVKVEKVKPKKPLDVPRTPVAKDKPKPVQVTTKYTGSLAQWLLTLRTCESTNNYRINTGNGFYGGYQFMISTWDRVAPKVGKPHLVGVRPDRASPADQDYMVIHNTKLSSGGLATQHPGCFKKHRLSQFPPS